MKCNSLLLKKVLHADISLSSRADYCWTSHLLTALDGLAHSDLMRHQMSACDPVKLSQFVVDLRTRHLSYWNQFTARDPRALIDVGPGRVSSAYVVFLFFSTPPAYFSIPRSAPSVKSLPLFLSTTSLFYIFISPTGCPVQAPFLLQLSYPCRQVQLCFPILSYDDYTIKPLVNWG
eukprot:1161612-Pelagomonas_calceolata.AAC.2